MDVLTLTIAREIVETALRNHPIPKVTVDDVDLSGVEELSGRYEVIAFVRGRIQAAAKSKIAYKWRAPRRRFYVNKWGKHSPIASVEHAATLKERLQDHVMSYRPRR